MAVGGCQQFIKVAGGIGTLEALNEPLREGVGESALTSRQFGMLPGAAAQHRVHQAFVARKSAVRARFHGGGDRGVLRDTGEIELAQTDQQQRLQKRRQRPVRLL